MVIMLVLLVVLLLESFNPVILAQDVTNQLAIDPVTIIYEKIPCMVNCYTGLEGQEITLLSRNAFNEMDSTMVLPTWFPCNEKIMTLALMINEMVAWERNLTNYNDIVRRKDFTDTNFFNESKVLLHYCLTDPLAQDPIYDDYRYKGKCFDPAFSFTNFCDWDDYLTSYNFVPCTSDNNFNEFLFRGNLMYSYREGLDIDNDFVCDELIGSDHNPPYSLCSATITEVDDSNCKPVWDTLSEQEVGLLGDFEDRGIAHGRCEDFAILYYSLFRSIGVSPDDLNLDLGICSLPCPCKELIRRARASGCANITSSSEECYVPATLTVTNLPPIHGCSEGMVLPERIELDGGRFVISLRDKINPEKYYRWIIDQNFTMGDMTAPSNRNLTLNGNYTDDVYVMSSYDGSLLAPFLSYYSSSENLITNVLPTTPINSAGNVYALAGASGALLKLNNLYSISPLKAEDNDTMIRMGFTVRVNNLQNCFGNNILFTIGFKDLDQEKVGVLNNTYLFEIGETRPVEFKHDLIVPPVVVNPYTRAGYEAFLNNYFVYSFYDQVDIGLTSGSTYSRIYVNGVDVSTDARGIHVAVLDRNGVFVQQRVFDMYVYEDPGTTTSEVETNCPALSNALGSFLRNLDIRDVVLMATQGEVSTCLDYGSAKDAIMELDSDFIDHLVAGDRWGLMTVVGGVKMAEKKNSIDLSISVTDPNENCKVNYEIIRHTEGLIVMDPCRSYYNERPHTISELVANCSKYISDNYTYFAASQSFTRDPPNIFDLIINPDASGCVIN